jgi:DNA modification methylase
VPDTSPLSITRQRAVDLKPHPENPRRGDVGLIADSLRLHGQFKPVIVQASTGYLIAGNHTRLAALRLLEEDRADGLTNSRWEHLYTVVRDLTDDEARAILLDDNRTSDVGGYDSQALLDVLGQLPSLDAVAGYGPSDVADLQRLLAPDAPGPVALTDADAIPDVGTGPTITQPGDLWFLGPHRLLCGDSTRRDDVDHLLGGETVHLLHSDPPYGMGKEADGIANDNLYGPKLDAFQTAWWSAWLPALADNGSAYVWGTAPDLWRWWYVGGLGSDPGLVLRNEIVWDKGVAQGQRLAGRHQYPTGSERCLFLMRGQQFLGNQNKADYWEGYEPLRAHLEAERNRAGWSNRDVNAITGTQMAGHWFTRSQFMPISANHYDALTQAADGKAFTRDYEELFAQLFPEHGGDGNGPRELAAALREGRSYFDNVHDAMRDVWAYGLVAGADRHDHATPKPVAMVERALLTSCPDGGGVGVPFAGTGPEFIAGHRTGRIVYGLELEPAYCDTVARRYAQHTGTTPVRQPAGTTNRIPAPELTR